jgi:quinol monooxygenase YgiN
MRNEDSTDSRPGTVRLTGFLHCASAKEVEVVRRHLPDHIRLTRAEPGCLSFEVAPTDDPLVWRVEELFANRAAFDLHQERTRASEWFNATSGMPRNYDISEPGRN